MQQQQMRRMSCPTTTNCLLYGNVTNEIRTHAHFLHPSVVIAMRVCGPNGLLQLQTAFAVGGVVFVATAAVAGHAQRHLTLSSFGAVAMGCEDPAQCVSVCVVDVGALNKRGCAVAALCGPSLIKPLQRERDLRARREQPNAWMTARRQQQTQCERRRFLLSRRLSLHFFRSVCVSVCECACECVVRREQVTTKHKPTERPVSGQTTATTPRTHTLTTTLGQLE